MGLYIRNNNVVNFMLFTDLERVSFLLVSNKVRWRYDGRREPEI